MSPKQRKELRSCRLVQRLALFLLCTWFAGCTRTPGGLQIRASEQANPWTHLDLHNNPDNFQFAIVSDLTAGLRPGVFESAVEKLNLLQPEFVMSVGDLIEGNTTDIAKLNREWDEFDGWAENLQMPFFYLPGNHDISNPVMAEVWKQRLGRTYFHFLYRDVLFLCVNTDDPPPRCIGNEQIEYFRKVLAANRDVRWTIVFMHRPTWLPDYSNKTPKNSAMFEALLAGRNYTVFAGHDHKYSKAVRDGHAHYVLSTTGAQGRGEDFITSRGNRSKALLGLEKGEFDHIVWVTMTDGGPVVANLLLDGILTDELLGSSEWRVPKPNRKGNAF